MGVQTAGFLYVAAASVLWGMMGTAVVKLQSLGYDVVSISAMRSAIGLAFAALTFAVTRPQWKRMSRADLAVFALAGLSGLAGIPIFYFQAIKSLGVGPAALIFYTKPLFVVMFAAVAIHEPLTLRKIVAMLLGFAGVALVVKGPGWQLAMAFTSGGGITAGIAAGVAGAIFAICNRISAQRFPSAVANLMNLAFGTGILWALEGIRLTSGAVHYSWSAIPWFVAMGTMFSAIPFALYLRGLRDVGAGEANVVALLEPIIAVIMGVAIFGEHLSAGQGLGILLVLLGAALIALRSETTKRRDEDAKGMGRSSVGRGDSGVGVHR